MPHLEELVKKLSEKKSLRIDFHNHCHTGSSLRNKSKPKGFREWFRSLFLEEGFSSLSGVLDRMIKKNLDVLYLTNTNEESRYEDWTSKEQIELAEKAGYEIEQGQYYVFAKKEGKVVALGKSQEVFTARGHFLFAGIKRGKKFSVKQSLEQTLAEATDGELKIADHPYAKLKGQNGVMATSQKPEEDAKKVDAFERNGNFHFPFSFANRKAIKYSRKYKKPLVADSDGHHPRDIGKTYNIFYSRNLSYTSERAFRDSINNAVRSNRFEYHYRPTPVYRIFHHLLMMVLNKTKINSYR